MQHNRPWTATLAKWPVESRPRGRGIGTPSLVMLTPVMLASVAMMTSGCSLGDSTLTTIGQPAAQSTDARAQGLQGAIRDDKHPEDHFAATPDQQAYLKALSDAGVQPSDELMALSIGAYVCQARAARQSEQAVWDFVLPLVRDDVDDAHATSVTPEAGEVNSATADYIRIATERLC